MKDILSHGGKRSQLSPGILMGRCANGTHTEQGWSQERLRAFLSYAGSEGATTVTIWSGLTQWRHTKNTTWAEVFPAAVSTCPWFVPTLLEWVAAE